MFREIKEELAKGPTNIGILSAKLGVSREQIENAFKLLVSMGIIEEVPLMVCEPKKSPLCAFCPLAKSCGKSPIKMYRLKSTEPLPKTS